MRKMHKINSILGLRRLGMLQHLEINDHVHVVKYDPIPLRDSSFVHVFARPVKIPDEGMVVYFYYVREKALSFSQGRPQAVIHSASTISSGNEQNRHIYDGILREFEEGIL